MKNFLTFFTLSLCLFFVACHKNEDHSLETETQPERPSNISFTNLNNYDINIPDVPPYAGAEELAEEGASERGQTYELSPGTNQLQAVINAASAGDKIVLLEGTHIEDETIVINRRIKLEGEEGAILSLGGLLGIYVIDARKTEIRDLTIVNGGTAVFGIAVESTNKFELEENHISGFAYSVSIEDSWKVEINDNTIIGSDPTPGTSLGITVINGNKAEVSGNDVSSCGFGIWACDLDGEAKGNTIHGNGVGFILCKVPEGSFAAVFSSGTGGSENPATGWEVDDNTAFNNIWGYLVVDGARDNKMDGNEGYDNAFLDMELAGETNLLFGFTTPTSKGNEVDAGDMNYIDCGEDNEVENGVEAGVPCSI